MDLVSIQDLLEVVSLLHRLVKEDVALQRGTALSE
jgi:hypothetical protein